MVNGRKTQVEMGKMMVERRRVVFWSMLLMGVVLAVVLTKIFPLRRERVDVAPERQGQWKISRVIDGDTIGVAVGSNKETVRLIGIDAPESVDPQKPAQCFGTEASQRVKDLLVDQEVELVSDESQTDRDVYGRLLRYVLLGDGTNLSKKLIEEGFAREYTFKVPYKYQDEFRSVEKAARENGVGLWGGCGR